MTTDQFFNRIERLKDKFAELPERTLSGPERETVERFFDRQSWPLSELDQVAALINRAEEVAQNRA